MVSTSILICTKDMRSTLPRAIASVRAQRAKDFELIVIDDGSSDGSWEYLSESRFAFPFKLIRHPISQGLTESRNRGLSESSGELVSILDADDMLAAHKTQWHLECFKKAYNVGVVWGRALVQKEKVSLIPPEDFVPGWDIAQDYQAVHSATTWNRESLLRVGGYERGLELVEGVDMFLKIGDSQKQFFTGSIDAYKAIDSGNDFRQRLVSEGKSLSQLLFNRTVKRRYQFSIR